MKANRSCQEDEYERRLSANKQTMSFKRNVIFDERLKVGAVLRHEFNHVQAVLVMRAFAAVQLVTQRTEKTVPAKFHQSIV